jgi:predicted  nucleic acid-binding Zn-ribbon protein
MATPEPQQPDAIGVDHVLAHPDQHADSDGVSSSSGHQPAQEHRAPDITPGREVEGEQIHDGLHDGQYAQSDTGAHNSVPGYQHNEADLDNQSEAMPLDKPDVDVSSTQVSSSSECGSPLPEHTAISLPGHASFGMLNTVVAPSGFMFPRLDRRNLGLGCKRKEAQHIIPHGSDLPASVPSSQNHEPHSETGSAQAMSSPILIAMNGDAAHSATRETVPSGSDGILADSQMSSQSMNHEQSPQKDHAQYQVDEQIMREASMSDGSERDLSSEAQSDGVVYVGVNSVMSNSSEPDHIPHETNCAQISWPAVRSGVPSRQYIFADPAQDTMATRAFSHQNKRAPGQRLNSTAARQQPRVHASPGRPRPRVTAPVPPPDETQDLLDVVAYKFKEKEQILQRAFSADQRKMQFELQQAYNENETLRSQVAAFEEQCHQSEAAISKFRSQIGKAKGLQKFLDGLGNDLHSLKRSHDIQKVNFAVRIEASETEIERLECSLAGKNEFETMLSHSNVTLEKLLDAKGFELQSVVQHRDMLRGQLDERMGQLVEERDTRMRLEQLVGQLRLDGRMSLTASLEQVTTSLLSKMSDLGQQGDELAIEIGNITHNVQTLTQQRPATMDDCKALKAEMYELGLRIAQGLSIEAATNTTVADLTASVEGLIQHHMRTLWQELGRVETGWKKTATSEQAHAALQAQLHGANERLAQLESQLNAARENEVSANTTLDRSLARISELEALALRSPTPNSGEVTSQDVELKVPTLTACLTITTDTLTGQGSSRSRSKTTFRQRKCFYCPRKGTVQQRAKEGQK